MPLQYGEGPTLKPEGWRPPASRRPYISTDATDIRRLIDLIDATAEAFDQCPKNGKVSQDEFLTVRDAFWDLLTLTWKVKGRLGL